MTGLEEFSKEIMEMMPQIMRALVSRERNELARGNITIPQMLALDALLRTDRMKMTDVARALSVKLSSATVLVDRLLKQGMLKRARDERDRRLVWVQITLKGRRVISQVHEEKQRCAKDVFQVLSPGEREEYLRILRKIKGHLVAHVKREAPGVIASPATPGFAETTQSRKGMLLWEIASACCACLAMTDCA